jgi:hypothetical protein
MLLHQSDKGTSAPRDQSSNEKAGTTQEAGI